MRVRSAWPWVAIATVVLALAALAGNPRSKGPPLDPSATSAQGAKALRLLLDDQQAHVDVASAPPPAGTADVALVLHDQLDGPGRVRLLDWVNGGGTLVVADPSSELAGLPVARAPGAGGLLMVAAAMAPGCTEPAMSPLGQINASPAVLFRVPPGSEGCFGDGQGDAYLVITRRGLGTVVALGGPGPWINSALGKLDNSVLATALLAPRPGTRVTWLRGSLAGGGHRSLADLVPDRVIEGLAQLVVAFVLLGLWRARRLGHPVLEPQPVELPGSELVVAVGNLLHRGHRIDQAAAILRADLARSLADRLGVGAGSRPDVLADVTAARTGLDRTRVLTTLAGPPPADEAGLIGLAQAADSIRREVARGHEREH